MKFKKGLKEIGFVLIAIGVFIIIIQPMSLTGAVIDLSTAVSKIWFFIGLGMVVVGIMVFVTFQQSQNYTPIKFKLLDDVLIEEGSDPDSVFIVDSSGIIDYKNDIGKMINGYGERTYIPKSVIDELGTGSRNKHFIESSLKKDSFRQLNIGAVKKAGVYDEIRKIRAKAREALSKTEKHKIYENIRDIINNNEIIPKGMQEDDFQDYMNEMDRLDSALRIRYGKDATKENRLWLLKKHTRVNKGDLDVLTNALFLAEKADKKAKIIARDSHLREAVDILTRKDLPLKRNLKYVQYSNKDEDSY